MKSIYVLIFLLSMNFLQAQKMGKFSKEELKKSAHSQYPDAVAEVLLDEVIVRYDLDNPRGNSQNFKYRKRIKIYKEAGLKYATFEIPILSDEFEKQKISKIRAYTGTWKRGEIVKTKLDKDNIKEIKSYIQGDRIKFTLPKVKAGSIIDVSYEISSPFLYQLPQWYFQDYIPTKRSIYEIDIPELFVLHPIVTGSHPVDNETEPVPFSKVGAVRNKLIAENVPPLPAPDHVMNVNDYRSGIKYQFYSTQLPGAIPDYHTKDWNKIAVDLIQSPDLGLQLRKRIKDFDPIIEKANGLELEDQIALLYDYVRTSFTWNKKFGIYSEKGIKSCVKSKSGNIADINLVLIYLLNAVDIEAIPLISKSRNEGVFNPKYPNLEEVNYLMAYIPWDDEAYFLDATDALIPFEELPPRALNISGIALYEKGAKVVDIPNPNIYHDQSFGEYSYDKENNLILASESRRKVSYAAWLYRNNFKDLKAYPELDFDNFVFPRKEEGLDIQEENLLNVNAPLKLKLERKIENVSTNTGDQITLDACLDFGLNKNSFAQAERDYPVFFKAPTYIRRAARINIPEGYKLTSHPEDLNLTLPNKLGSFSYTLEEKENQIRITYLFRIGKKIIYHEDYPALSKFYLLIENVTKEKIILTRV